ncbi:ImmA/IrrE family metallo-endopeptidase [Halarcobacter sp.]|uniref:ImmA/IrrE family metallo-endopeptidase n=1 Tax=Halarcobacter sp. TaxID=2321133 RepID=UPI003A958CAA
MSIPYNPKVLVWARERLGYDQETVANKMNKTIEVIDSWEKGISSPTYVQLEKLAYDVYKKPLAVFFFPNPPKIDKLENSFRTFAEYEFSQISPKIKLLIDKAYAYQLNIKELNKEIEYSSILENINFDLFMNTEDMTKKLRRFLDVSIQEQIKWKSIDYALKYWIKKLEELGIFIFKDAFKDNSYSGFCLYDKQVPIIYINNSTSKSRQIFTLFHELAHLLFNTSGVDSREHIEYFGKEEETIEIHCNKFAGLFLVPDYHFEEKSNNLPINELNISKLAKYYCVSKEVILRKFLDSKKITQDYYHKMSDKWNKEFKENKKRQKKGPPPYIMINSYLSNNYKDIVFSKLIKKRITSSDAIDYLSIKPKYLNTLINLYMREKI